MERSNATAKLHYLLKKYLDVFLYDQNIIGSSLEILGYLRIMFRNDWQCR